MVFYTTVCVPNSSALLLTKHYIGNRVSFGTQPLFSLDKGIPSGFPFTALSQCVCVCARAYERVYERVGTYVLVCLCEQETVF